MLREVLLVLILLHGLAHRAAAGSDSHRMTLEHDTASLGIPFDRYFTTDGLGRKITSYVSKARSSSKRLPVILLIQGSGSQSLWSRTADGKIAGGYQNILLDVCQERARVVVVEKPGVAFLQQPQRPGSAEEGSKEFLEEHTLPRWAEANIAVLKGLHLQPDIDATRTLVMGHSEGGIVAARIAAEVPAVTHVASLAGGGPSQLFDLAYLARIGAFGDPAASPDDRVKAIYDEWARIQADPGSITKFAWGHPYRRWASFIPASTTAELLRSKARIYLAHGSEDTASSVVTLDFDWSELLIHGRNVTVERIQGVSHGFEKKGETGYPKGMQELFGRVVGWFLH
jgi:dienelactone hydrolase